MAKSFTDQMNQTIRLEEIPCRIVSLVPSQTELLCDLGLDEKVIGITKFCIHPTHWFKSKTRVGGTKQLNIDVIHSLKPDLIIGNKEENTKEDIELLQQIAPVWMSDISTLDEAYEMINQIGDLTNLSIIAKQIITEIKQEFSRIVRPNSHKSVLYFIWKNPYFVAGTNTFINSIICELGFENFCPEERYPELKNNAESYPDFIFLSSEPYPFKKEDVIEIEQQFPHSKVVIVDGEMFSWYGSRLKYAPNYFIDLIQQLTNK
jgi:ABC-type Fe3+-hydroxamate transport system substrate-binding protein